MSPAWLLLPCAVALILVGVEAVMVGPSVSELVDRALGPEDDEASR